MTPITDRFFLWTFAAILIATLVAASELILISQDLQQIESQIDKVKQQIEKEEERNEHLQELKDTLKRIEQIEDRQQRWMDKLQIEEMNVTMYAPLDDEAIAGRCFSGDPNITASGQQVAVGHTAAAGSNLEFGTKIWIEGIGWRVVQDRGGAIGAGDIDVAVHCLDKAMKFGRQQRRVIVVRG